MLDSDGYIYSRKKNDDTTFYIQSNYPALMVVVNYFEKTYLGSAIVDSEVRVPPTYPLEFRNHFASILQDPEFPRTSNMVEGFHRGFKTLANRPKPSVQEYFRTIKEQQVVTDYHLPAHLQVNYTQSMDHITNYKPQASSLHVNYLMTYMVDHITSAPKSGSQKESICEVEITNLEVTPLFLAIRSFSLIS